LVLGSAQQKFSEPLPADVQLVHCQSDSSRNQSPGQILGIFAKYRSWL